MHVRVLLAVLCVGTVACERSDSPRVSPGASAQATTPGPRGPTIAEHYDGRWWVKADSVQRETFVAGFLDCYSTEIRGDASFEARSLVSYRDSVTVWYAGDPSRATQPFFAAIRPFADRPGEHAPTGGEHYSEPHGYFDGDYWRVYAAERPAREAFVAGYLVCRTTLGARLPGRFSRSAADYTALVDRWYGLDERTGDVADGRETAKIGDVLHRFADAGATPAVANTDAEADTAGCAAIPKHQFEQPIALVREWVHRDSLGLFLAPDDRLFELTACPGHLGGGDEAIIAIDPTIQPIEQRRDAADFLITYRRFGRIHVDSTGKRTVFESDPGIDSIPVNVVPTPFGWRFPNDVANPHLSPRIALRAWQGDWVRTSRDSLERLAGAMISQ